MHIIYTYDRWLATAKVQPPREKSMGRRPQIGRAAILDAAMLLADERGLEAVTMHAVAQRLGVTPMALYRHVDGKQALLDGLVERLLADHPLPPPDAPWPARLTAMAEAVRSTAKRHPAVFPLLLTRPAATPAALTVRDSVQATLREAGLAAEEVARAERLISTAVLGFAASEAAGRFRHHAQAAIDEDFTVLLRWLRLALTSNR
jgi:AcrR family transcriptional regulator